MYPYIWLGPKFAIQTYFVVICFAVVLATFWFLRRAKERHLSRIRAIDLTAVVLVSGFVGARLLHVFYEQPAFYRVHPLVVFEVWRGGFVFLGGLVGAFFGALIYCEWKREPFWFWADTIALPISLAYAIGRVACLLNGCCYGEVCVYPWAIFLHGHYRHPTQIYASAWEFATLFILSRTERRLRTAGTLFATWLILHGFGRIIMEHFRADPRGPFMYGHSLGTWMSFGAICTGIFLWTSFKRR